MREGNACFGLFIGFVLAMPVYLGLAAVVARLAHIAYGLALVGTLVVGSVTGGIVLVVGLVKAKRM